MKFYSISILIPTLNAATSLEECLRSISYQNYPKEKLEIIIADGGSTDDTLGIVRKFKIQNSKFKIQVYPNPLKTGESGKAVALRHAQGEVVALIDSDNVLPDKKWLQRMVEPFADSEIMGSEPWEFTYRRGDGFIDRYCALLGMNDPLCLFLGNYDKRSVLTGRWTGLPVQQEDKGNWLKVTLKPDILPTIGANGTILRRSNLLHGWTLRGNKDYLFDIDTLAYLAKQKPVKFAKVKTGIIHLYCGSNVRKFIRKQKRRIKDYLYYQKIGARIYPWQKQNKIGLLKFVMACVIIIPLLCQAIKGYLKKPDPAWFFHPLACWITFFVYGWERINGFFTLPEINRQGWRQ